MNPRTELEHQFYDVLMDSQFWPIEQIVALQREQLEQLVRHARKNVPFYESRLDPLFRSNGEIDWSRWSEIPLVKRSDLREHHFAMQARQLPPGHGPVTSSASSGSTGLPISVSSPSLMMLPHRAILWRCHRWNDVDWSQSICSRQVDAAGVALWPEGLRTGNWGPAWMEGPRGAAWQLNKATSSENTLEFLLRTGCRYFNNGPKVAHALALDAERLGVKIRLDAVLAQGGRVGQEDRDAVGRVFGARMIEHYSSKEAGQIAHPCPHGRLHVAAESVLVEILDDNGRPCAPGTPGRVVISTLYNTAQPLIRYEQGDIAVLGGPCTCGRHLPVLEQVLGRTVAIFRHPDGRALAWLMPHQHREKLGCDFWQIAQTGPNHFEVRYVPVSGKPSDPEAFIAAFRSVYFEDAEVRLVELKNLPLTEGGKFLEYVNEYAPGA